MQGQFSLLLHHILITKCSLEGPVFCVDGLSPVVLCLVYDGVIVVWVLNLRSAIQQVILLSVTSRGQSDT